LYASKVMRGSKSIAGQAASFDMVSDETRPFYQMGTLMTLNKIPEADFSSFVCNKFAGSGKKISRGALKKIIAECENIPHYVQLLSFNLWDHFQKVSNITEAHVEKALLMTLHSQEPAYLTLWEGLTIHQKKTVKAAAKLGGRLLTAKNSIQQFNFLPDNGIYFLISMTFFSTYLYLYACCEII